MVTEKKSTVTYRKWDRGAMREFSEEVTIVRMDNDKITYAMGITQEGYLLHCYYGAHRRRGHFLPDASAGSSVYAKRQ